PAGLTAALRLSAQGHQVTLVEEPVPAAEPPEIGDVLPTFWWGHDTATRDLLTLLGIHTRLAHAASLSLEFHPPPEPDVPAQPPIRLPRPWLPRPAFGLVSLWLFKALPLADRWHLITRIERAWERDPALPLDLDARSGADWLLEWGQSERACVRVWDPLSRFLLGDGLTGVSAALLVGSLSRCFFSTRRASRLAWLSESLRDLILDPARARLDQSGAVTRMGGRAMPLQVQKDRVTGIPLEDGRSLQGDWYVLALAHDRVAALVPERLLTRYSYFQHLTRLEVTPLVLQQVRVPTPVRRPRLILLSSRPFDWVLATPTTGPSGQAVLLSMVAAGEEPTIAASAETLREAGLRLALELFGEPAADAEVVTLQRWTRGRLAVQSGAAAMRPLPQSPIDNLLLAGEWTDTGLPPTVESAVRSGLRCAEVIVEQASRRRPSS
ncbi:MAG: hydroxysqualene dehydroxylase, partial [Nitrospirales bacterium]